MNASWHRRGRTAVAHHEIGGLSAGGRKVIKRTQYWRASSSVMAVLMAALVMVTLAPPEWAAAVSTSEADTDPISPIRSKPFDGTFSSGLRRQMWSDTNAYKVIVNGAPTVVAVPAGAHDSVEVNLTIDQGDGYAHGSYGVFLSTAVSPFGATPAAGDWVTTFESHTANATEVDSDVRLTWDHRVDPAQIMNLHVRCYTWDSRPESDRCTIANIRGFEDTPGGWVPVAWNGPRQHGFGVYAKEMPLVVGNRNYGPRITADGLDNPFLGVERSLAGYGVRLRGPLVTLPTFTQTAPLSASVRWRRTTNAVSGEMTSPVRVNFMPVDSLSRERTLLTIPAGSTSTSDWQTLGSGPLSTTYFSGKVGYFIIEPADSSLGPIQAVGIDSLTFYVKGEPVAIPVAPPASAPTYKETSFGGADFRSVRVDLADPRTMVVPQGANNRLPLIDNASWEPRWDDRQPHVQDLKAMYDGAPFNDKVALINTDYFCRDGCQGDAGAPQGLFYRDGVRRHWAPLDTPRAALTFSADNRASIGSYQGNVRPAGVQNAVSGGPTILKAGVMTCNSEGSDLGYRCGTADQVRSGACISSDGRTLWLIGTTTKTTWSNMARFMKEQLGCADGLQFDGGSSAGLVFRGDYKVFPASVGSGLLIRHQP